ncbi:ERAD-associated E3 ubiquitin-protein ligase doa10 [Psilocybe cubensis]|uniref:RING-type E3 ubiquitin transferase n=2 Tax=Psilocybe cubensis TaxID=181762 RepID=A0A8H7XW21_PSICU|nr:ERAD-associated E3 ubiquitin-protein ligase doa10 [Psilocybe cubensis]KAH9479708.1 ERAD-associated E3 ubiquitin-protein ligase doa10 [Psilocybe cubensis]
MPSSLPPLLLIRRLLQQLFFAVLFVLRGIAVATIWLGVLPWVTVWTWRMYFSMGESAAWWISDRPRPPSTEPTATFFNRIRYEVPVPPSKSIYTKVSSHPVWIALSADIFTGQIIASLIVLIFVAVFLLREWISQNARPGVFEEEELPELPPVPAPPPPQPQPQQQPRLVRHFAPLDPANPNLERELRARAAFNERQIEALRAMEAMRQNLDPNIAVDPNRWRTDAQIAALRDRKKKMKAKGQRPPHTVRDENQGETDEEDVQFELEQAKKKIFNRHVTVAQASRRSFPRPPSPELEVAELQNTLDFVIPLDGPTAKTASSAGPSTSPVSPDFFAQNPFSSSSKSDSPFPPVALKPPSGDIPFSLRGWQTTNTNPTPSHEQPEPVFPPVTLQPPADDIPFSLRGWQTTSQPISKTVSQPQPEVPLQAEPVQRSASTGSAALARPPLPMAPLPQSGHNSPFLFSPGKTSVDSPSHSTYRAPEELQKPQQPEAGPSNPTANSSRDYFTAAYPSSPAEATNGHDEEAEREEWLNAREEAIKMMEEEEIAMEQDSKYYSVRQRLNRRRAHHPHHQHWLENASDDDAEVESKGKGKMKEMEMNIGASTAVVTDVGIGGASTSREPHGAAATPESALPDSDVDMEVERNRYFQAAAEAKVGDGGEPGLVSPSESDDTEEDDEDDFHEDDEVDDRHGNGHRNRRPHPLRRPHLEEEDDDEDDDAVFFREPNDDDGVSDDEEDQAQWNIDEQQQGRQQARAGAPAGGAGGEREIVQWGAPGVPGGAPVANDADVAAGLDLEDADANGEDELEGVMEAIGMRGPIFGVFQNAALMIFVLDTAIGICVWVPFTIGKTTALLTLDPKRLLQVLHLPIRAMRYLTDPFVDVFVFIIMRVLLPRIGSLLGKLFQLFWFLGSNTIGKLLGQGISSGISEFSLRMYNQSADIISKPLAQLSAWTSPANITTESISPANSTDLLAALPDYLGFTEPYFEVVGREVRVATTEVQQSWVRLSLGNGPLSRFFAISLGYCVVSVLLLFYLNVLTVGNARTAGVAVRNAIRQQLLVLKVAAFIFIELVVFPLGCGIVLDLCTVWLFPEANLQSRIAFFYSAPLTAMFYHWVAGTMFMYSFAVLLSGCRSVMRPGAMWFIKDPQDQNSHPIRDILDRPTLTQLRKICVSGLMYSFVVACVVGSVAALLVLGSKSILPFRWKNREPLSNVPIDLLFLHLVLPYTMHYFRPKKTIKHFTTIVWKFIATRLRLTSYFFGGRYPEEEFTPKHWKENFIRGNILVVMDDDHADGTFRRVPATDNLALPRDMRATVAVDARGEPVDEAARELMELQNAEAEKAKRSVKDDYMIVYMPPHFRWRIIAFIVVFWIFGAVVLGVGVAVPVQLGRSFFRLFTPREVHDGYSFIIGFYLLWVCYLTAKAVDRLDKRRQRRSADGPRADLYILVLKRGLLWIAKTAYMVLFLGIVLPTLLALVIDLYIILPIRLMYNPSMVPHIRIVDLWALGLLYSKIAMLSRRMQPNRITRGLQIIAAHGWTRPDPVRATKDVIGPLCGGFLGMIILPGAAFRALQYLFPSITVDNRFMFMHVYPAVFIIAGGVRTAMSMYGVLSAWSQAVRDKEFLVEMRLRNHEPEMENEVPPAMAPASATTAAASGTGGGGGGAAQDGEDGPRPAQQQQQREERVETDVHWDEYLAENERINAERRAALL